MNKFTKEFFILIKDDCLRLLNDNIEWKPETICKMPYGQPIAHALFVDNRFSSADIMLMVKEFKAIYPKSIFKGNLYICIPDDYSIIETTAIKDFLLMTKYTNRVSILYYSQCIGIKYEITEYIAITATKRCITLNNIINQGVLKEIEFLSWQDGKENIQKVLINWGNKPIYLCDPNHLLEDYVSFGIDKMDITEDIFIKAKKFRKNQ